MEKKKTEKADLENKKSLFMQIGLVVTLAGVLVAFEWKSYDAVTLSVASTGPIEDQEMVIQTVQEPPPPPPPPPAEITTELNVVENDAEIEKEVEISAETDEKAVMEVYVPPVVVQEEEVKEDEIFIVVEENPGYPGGDEARQKYLSENIQYPAMARETGISGTVYLTFVVEKDGSVTDVKVLRGIGGGCDEEAIRVLQKMPRWTPGKQRGKPVRVQYSMPVKYTLAG